MKRNEFLKAVAVLPLSASAATKVLASVGSKPKVYFTREITPASLVKMFKALNKPMKGEVALKIHSGEPGGHNFLKPDFMKPLADLLGATIVECNTAYEGRRNTTQKHWGAIREHGFDKIAKVDIMDAEGELALPVKPHKQISENFVGSHLKNYGSMLVLSHFKGHQMGGFGGALKNMSIGVASSRGKEHIHGAGDPKRKWSCPQNMFLEAMADADKSVMDFMKGNIAFINVMRDISIDCDCNNHPAAPEMADIGILSSLDPVALDAACVDLVYSSEDKGKASLIKRIESLNGTHILEAAEELGVGSRAYELVNLDA